MDGIESDGGEGGHGGAEVVGVEAAPEVPGIGVGAEGRCCVRVARSH